MKFRTNIFIQCPKCGQVGRLIIRIRGNSKECYIYHGYEKIEINNKKYYRQIIHSISCIDLEQKHGIKITIENNKPKIITSD